MNTSLASGEKDRDVASHSSIDHYDRCLAWVRDAAGERFSSLELQIAAFAVMVVDSRRAATQIAAMLGFGRIAPKPWVHQGELAVRQVVQLSLTFDHRVCDGGTAGGFLRSVADCVEQPAMLLRAV